MSFEQLRTLVISLIEPAPAPAPEPEPDDDRQSGPARPLSNNDDPIREFDTQATHYLGPRTSTLDQLIAFLRRH
ncbi:MAG TPA: hypothetical protein VHW23_28365 [Kofleriaceae bacterium]|jgi:hypothetical protein|nr:hypothetical protein [Kofleriaceae bacterium]